MSAWKKGAEPQIAVPRETLEEPVVEDAAGIPQDGGNDDDLDDCVSKLRNAFSKTASYDKNKCAHCWLLKKHW